MTFESYNQGDSYDSYDSNYIIKNEMGNGLFYGFENGDGNGSDDDKYPGFEMTVCEGSGDWRYIYDYNDGDGGLR